MAAASSAISFLMSSAVPSTWYFHRTARAAKLKFPSSEGARTPGPVYRIAFCPRYHRGFRPSPTLTESTDSFLAGRAVVLLAHVGPGSHLAPPLAARSLRIATLPQDCIAGHLSAYGMPDRPHSREVARSKVQQVVSVCLSSPSGTDPGCAGFGQNVQARLRRRYLHTSDAVPCRLPPCLRHRVCPRLPSSAPRLLLDNLSGRISRGEDGELPKILKEFHVRTQGMLVSVQSATPHNIQIEVTFHSG